MAYSDEYIAETLALLEANGGNMRKTARQAGVTHRTIQVWKEQITSGEATAIASAASKVTDKKRALALRFEHLAHSALDAISDAKLEKLDGYKLALTSAVATDKMALLLGETPPGSQVNVMVNLRGNLPDF